MADPVSFASKFSEVVELGLDNILLCLALAGFFLFPGKSICWHLF